MRVLVACEFSGRVRDWFKLFGHDAWSCDILPTESKGQHYQGNVLDILHDGWDLMIGHPPCTYLSRAGARWWGNTERMALADEAASFTLKLWNSPIDKIAIENPIGQLNKRWRYPDQIIQPWQFGHPFSKATCLWLKGLPKLTPTDIQEQYQPLLPSNTGIGKRMGQKSSPGVTRCSKIASRTFHGIAFAMASQWGSL